MQKSIAQTQVKYGTHFAHFTSAKLSCMLILNGGAHNAIQKGSAQGPESYQRRTYFA